MTEDTVDLQLFVLVDSSLVEHQLCLVGSSDVLGRWCPENALQLSPCSSTPPHISSSTIRLPKEALEEPGVVECKLVAAGLTRGGHGKGPSMTWQWEQGQNRRLKCEVGGKAFCVFGSSAHCAVSGFRALALEARCDFTVPGDELVVVGSSSTALGAWQPLSGCWLSTRPSTFPYWSGTVLLEANETDIAWKLVVVRADGSFVWEDGKDRQLLLPEVGSSKGLQAWKANAAFGCTEESSTVLSLDLPAQQSLDLCFAGQQKSGVIPRDLSTISSVSTCSSLSLCFTPGGESEMHSPGRESDSSDPDEDFTSPWLWAGSSILGKTCGRCEDAFFIRRRALGVADGVGSIGSFSRHGVDSAAFSSEIMQIAGEAMSTASHSDVAPELRAVEAVSIAEREVTSYGAATMTVLELQQDYAGVANLGDSGFMVIRPPRVTGSQYEVIARSREQQHSFNYPYQLARLPTSLLKRVQKGAIFDTADDCDLYSVNVEVGDLVLLFTDGFSDNLFTEEILDIVERVSNRHRPRISTNRPTRGDFARLPEPRSISQELAVAAQQKSLDPTAKVPFTEAAQQSGKLHEGGKDDDITVLAAWIMPAGQ
eukprot:CAMPEP_0197624484 /NCGR_PEP_ID=MMETSP1338-20131121/4096_1 /TAXON_ID=43686 ORGANISM="Pelagodinium beii, Strain RCC1491" /NCGR_SAMPLE_ID=MMETSP1338 /ASSEMBLY_ACC=CAM_ASM_000754 /LENGTH=595 /DNA_ID=CAMNT_0043194623 /DNA_START=101 /DNA_END=1888 /DNA_ORIENTATION=+